MKLKSQYNFKEFELGPDFAKEKMAEFTKMIETSQSFTAMAMPGVGASYFLKYLAMRDFAYFIHVDMYSLPTLTLHEFYRMFHRDLGGKPTQATDEQIFLETKAILKKLAEENNKVVVIFSRFDQLKKELDENFLSNLQSLTTIIPGSPREATPKAGEAGKIVLIFTAIKPLHELSPDAITGGNLPFYSKILYFKPYSKEDLKKLLKIEPEQLAPGADLDKLLELSGGHNQFLHILLNSQKQQNLLLDKFVKLQLKDLVDYLDYGQRKQIQKIALGKKLPEVDEYLLGVGMVKKEGSNYQLFTPLLEEYIKTNLPVKLPVKEGILFRLLRKNAGNVVPKDEIFQEVWGEDQENATDWALDALIYRLRKHPFIQSHGYIIESHKKVGYTLIQA